MKMRYGINPHRAPASASPLGEGSPLRVLHGDPSYTNLLDALNAWRLVSEAERALGEPVATSFKHVSPAGAATAGPLDEVMTETYGLETAGPLTSAYVRARDADPRASYGDVVAVSRPVDLELAGLLRRVVSDAVIAPGYEEGVLELLRSKKGGRFLVLEADPGFRPPAEEIRDVYGLRCVQARDDLELNRRHLDRVLCGELDEGAVRDLLLGLIVVRHTQSNSIAYARAGMALGIGAGQQSRIDCTRLAGAKADTWWLRRHPSARRETLEAGSIQDRVNRQYAAVDALSPEERREWLAERHGLALASDGSIPFIDNVEEAARHGVGSIAEPGGAMRSDDVVEACRRHGIALVHTGVRLFHH
jgi:phosphoribosylaminoimidazolecarboxamide formyltransferase/IMP cyclohydrolase